MGVVIGRCSMQALVEIGAKQKLPEMEELAVKGPT